MIEDCLSRCEHYSFTATMSDGLQDRLLLTMLVCRREKVLGGEHADTRASRSFYLESKQWNVC